MTWYLTIRAFCIVSFVIAFASLFGAGIAADTYGRPLRWVITAFAFAFTGCVLIGLGWTPEHP